VKAEAKPIKPRETKVMGFADSSTHPPACVPGGIGLNGINTITPVAHLMKLTLKAACRGESSSSLP
jgi:hypothetical protein